MKFSHIPLLFLSAVALLAQPVQIGVKGGIVAHQMPNFGSDRSGQYSVGPTVEIKLPHQFALELDFLYRRPETHSSYTFSGLTANYSSRANSWELPVLGKYYFRPASRWQPYVSTGFSLRKQWYTNEGTIIAGPENNLRLQPFRDSGSQGGDIGAVAAGGVRWNYGRLKLAPEFRYTRWAQESSGIPLKRNQAEFLFGISF